MLELSSPLDAAQWLRARVHGNFYTDSRKLAAGDGFIAWPGVAVDGRKFVEHALKVGASACLVEADGAQAFHFVDERVASYRGLKIASGSIAAEIFDQPSAQMDVLAVTGTNGKTSTAWWLAQALNVLHAENQPALLSKTELSPHYICGLIGTLGVGIPSQMVHTGLTTPDPVMLQAQLQQMHQNGIRACAIEASSIGIAEHRLDGTRIRMAVFTNFTQDHLDYHGSMHAYWLAKRALFDWPGLQVAVVNLDDPKGEELAQYAAQRGLDVWSVSRRKTVHARLKASDLAYSANALQFMVCEGQQRVLVKTSLLGDYNVSNLLGVLAVLRALGHSLQLACSVMQSLGPVPGRLEFLDLPEQPLVAIDYAHTPDALAQVLSALRTTAHARAGKLWCVFGCGGDRDANKRPQMAVAAERGSDHVVVTSDNPRSEKMDAIIDQIMCGFIDASHVIRQPDRALAIAQAIHAAAPQDVVLIAGKGHERYQEISGVQIAFSDLECAQKAMQERAS